MRGSERGFWMRRVSPENQRMMQDRWPSWQTEWAIPARRAHEGRDCGAAEIRRIAEDAPRWPNVKLVMTCGYFSKMIMIRFLPAAAIANCRGRERRASDVWRRRFACPHKWLRNEPNKTEHEPTNGRSIYYESGRLIPAFHGIERTFSWLFSLAPMPCSPSIRRLLVSCLRPSVMTSRRCS
jgi:hypothetical protein